VDEPSDFTGAIEIRVTYPLIPRIYRPVRRA
jgi:hypothetical protein